MYKLSREKKRKHAPVSVVVVVLTSPKTWDMRDGERETERVRRRRNQ